MDTLVGRLVKGALALPAAVVGLHTAVRIVRHFVKFPVPEALADLIDNPLRRRLQPPGLLAERHGVRPGMTVLDIDRATAATPSPRATRSGRRAACTRSTWNPA